MQKHSTDVGLKLLWHQKWYTIHAWRHQMTSTSQAYMTSLVYEKTFKHQNVHYILW